MSPELHPVASGRLFIRSAVVNSRAYGDGKRYPGAKVILGVVEAPKSTDVERTHTVRLNSSPWMDTENAGNSLGKIYRKEDIAEMDVSSLLTTMDYRVHVLPDSFDVFLRATFIPHEKDFEFARRMDERCPETLVYTAEQLAAREKVSGQVIRELVAKKDREDKEGAAVPASKPASVHRARP